MLLVFASFSFVARAKETERKKGATDEGEKEQNEAHAATLSSLAASQPRRFTVDFRARLFPSLWLIQVTFQFLLIDRFFNRADAALQFAVFYFAEKERRG